MSPAPAEAQTFSERLANLPIAGKDVIASRRNALIAKARSLRHKKFREQHRAFLVEGPRVVAELIKSKWTVSDVLVDNCLVKKEKDLQELCKTIPSKVRLVKGELLSWISDAATHQGIMAIAEKPERDLEEWEPAEEAVALVLDGISDPGNVGAMVRTADAFGAEAVLMTSDCADCYSPKCVRATAGSIFHLPIYTAEVPAICRKLKSESFQIVGASVRGVELVTALQWRQRVALVFGHETRGMRAETMDCLTNEVRIPMSGRAESLNVAAAAAVMLWEVSRHRVQQAGRQAALNDTEGNRGEAS